jgi:hypothetical protein
MTVIQQMMNELNESHPHLFNIHTTAGRKFIETCHKYLEIEKKQLEIINTAKVEVQYLKAIESNNKSLFLDNQNN